MSDTAPVTSRSLPPSVSNAVLTIWVLVGLTVLNTVLTIAMKDTLIESWAEASPGWKRFLDDGGVDSVREYAPAFVPLAVISLVVFGLIFGALALALRQGQGWARIALTVLAALNILSTATVFVQSQPVLFVVLRLVVAVACVALLVLLWRRETSEYLRGGATA